MRSILAERLTGLLVALLLPFGQSAPLHVTAIAPYGFVNTVLRIHFGFERGIVYGEETATVRTRRSLDALPFDSLGIHYDAITVNGQAATFTDDAPRQRIVVHLPHAVAAGTRLTVAFRYWVRPQRGVFFIRPSVYPHDSPEIWTQGETTDNRRWFPTWDEPNDKTPSELVITVPRNWTVVANGYLRSHTVHGSTATWDWDSPRAKSTYLIAFAAGRFSEFRDHLGALRVDSFVPLQDAAFNRICFRDTPRMIAYYQRIIGFPYPFAKYDQIAVEHFIFGGMENASATILTDAALHPAAEDVERNCDHLVSHELAQQWFGDDVTMSDWSNEWINEGFATYFDELWTGQQAGEAGFEYARYEGEQAYFAETQRYMRPIVDYRYRDPIALFDASGHERAAAVLQMLRYLVGDERFFHALHVYLARYQYGNADTYAFFASMEQTLHENLGWFEHEWFFRASYPHYIVTDVYDAAAKRLTLTVRQHNADGQPFRMPVAIDVFAGRRVIGVRPWIDRDEQRVRIDGVGAPPQMILFDPNGNLLRRLTFEQPVTMLAYQLRHAAHVGDREWALTRLAAVRGPKQTAAMRAVSAAALDDPVYGVRADAVAAAAKFGDVHTVLTALHDGDPRVRIAAEEASARLPKGDPAVNAALTLLSHDGDPDIAGAAVKALGARNLPRR